jgi:cobalt transporter subunit CbtB|tara:strand:+ start:61 stop:237 length:177 start_codon:yes stop_codon:yes gene_type:complete
MEKVMGMNAVKEIQWNSVALTVTALLGIMIVLAVGFASPEIIHSAAHDVRHGMNLICH